MVERRSNTTARFCIIFDLFRSLLHRVDSDETNGPVLEQTDFVLPYNCVKSLEQLKAKGYTLIANATLEDSCSLEDRIKQYTDLSALVEKHFPSIFGVNTINLETDVKGTSLFEVEKMRQFKRYEIFYVSTDLGQVHLPMMKMRFRAIWFNDIKHTPQDQITKNAQLFKKAVDSKTTNPPDFTIICLESILSIMSFSAVNDARYIQAKGTSSNNDDYYAMFKRGELPSQKRIPFGLLYDKMEDKFLNKPSIQALLNDRERFVCVPMYLHSDLSVYASLGICCVIQKIMYHINALREARTGGDVSQETMDTQKKLMAFLNPEGAPPVRMLDEIDSILEVQDRFNLNTRLKSFFKTQSKEIQEVFDVPAYVELENVASMEERIVKYRMLAEAAGLEFPVLIKQKVGQTDKYAHLFFHCKNEAGLREALAFEGYTDKLLLVQAFVPHYEQVYKIYGIAGWYKDVIRHSLPQTLFLTKDAYPFDSQKKFDPSLYSEYNHYLSHLDHELCQPFFEAFSEHFNLKLYGVDIIVDSRSGKHYVIDCNYLSNYTTVSLPLLTQKLDQLIYDATEARKALMQPAEDTTEQQLSKSSNTLLIGALVIVAVAATALVVLKKR